MFEIVMGIDDLRIQLVKYWNYRTLYSEGRKNRVRNIERGYYPIVELKMVLRQPALHEIYYNRKAVFLRLPHPTHAVRAHPLYLSKEPSHPFPHRAQDSGSLPEIVPVLFSFILFIFPFFDGNMPTFNNSINRLKFKL